ncbi:MAG: RNA 2',3'-cyclic phosphodiesterase [Nitrospirae bacterium]|nr:RNA 2',3'-cyclic phosphodiesterase [Nitrospirota bacterium]
MRCFIAVSLPEELKSKISCIQEKLKAAGADVSWTRKEGMHLTLKFLGDKDEVKIPDIKKALDMAVDGIVPFSLSVSGLGIFPDMRRPRVVWVGLKEEGDNVIRLQKGVEAELKKRGFPAEGRSFTPHITLGRIRTDKNIEKLLRLIDDEKRSDPGGFPVSEIHLIKSELKPSGAVYTELFSVMLSSGAKGKI